MLDQHALRKAAILVASLDHTAADEMLERMPRHQAEAIRHTILSLRGIDDAEETNVIRDFLRGRLADSIEKSEPEVVGDSDDVTFSLSQAENEATTTSDESSLERLSDNELATFLRHERVPTIAGVLARVPNERAAAVIGRLTPEKRPQVLRALAQGAAASDAAIEEIWAELAAQSQQRTETCPTGRNVDHAKSILLGIEGPARDDLLARLAVSDEILARRLGWTDSAPHAPQHAGSEASQANSTTEAFLDIATGHEFRQEALAPEVATRDDSPADHIPRTFEDLLQLDDAALAAALGAVEPKVAVLALTGPGEGVLNRLARHLPPHQTRQIRKRIRQQEPFVLADIQVAQQHLVDAVRRRCLDRESGQPAK